MTTRTADVAIVGGGIVGLALADALLDARPGSEVVVLDKEGRLGAHASGRNSGVMHAGFYYSPDSLKAQLTRRGNVLLHEFCDEHDVPVRRCGKLVVAQHEDDLPALDQLLARAAANGVPVESVDEERARELEPLARTVGRALWSPTTSSADPASGSRCTRSAGPTAGRRDPCSAPRSPPPAPAWCPPATTPSTSATS